MKRFVGLIGLLVPLLLGAKNPTVSGYVTDVQTGERLIGATVQDVYSGAGTVTNVHGFYSLTLPADSVSLRAGYVGYESLHTADFILRVDTLMELE